MRYQCGGPRRPQPALSRRLDRAAPPARPSPASAPADQHAGQATLMPYADCSAEPQTLSMMQASPLIVMLPRQRSRTARPAHPPMQTTYSADDRRDPSLKYNTMHRDLCKTLLLLAGGSLLGMCRKLVTRRIR